VIAVSIPGQDFRSINLPGISRQFPAVSGNIPVHGIPSLIKYELENTVHVGEEVARGVEADDPAIARGLRQYLIDRSPVQIPAGDGRMVRCDEAAMVFLTRILTAALRQYPRAELVMALPQNASPQYADVLHQIARSAGTHSCEIVGEYRAALTGYGVSPHSAGPSLVLSFGETGFDAAAMILEETGDETNPEDVRILARATSSVNCRMLDNWIVQDLLEKFRLLESDPRALRLEPQLRYEATRLREYLPFTVQQELQLTDPVSKKTFTTRYTADDLSRIIAEHGVIPALLECIDRVISGLRIRSGDGNQIGIVLLLGEGCLLPQVREAVTSRFPKSRVYADLPVDAIARGASAFRPPTGRQNRIVSSYALRYWDPTLQEHHYRFLVHSGSQYPSAGQVARIVISAAYDGQTYLGIPIYELGGKGAETMGGIELVSDIGGGMHLAGPAKDADSQGQAVYANERTPTLLVANPPARKGEPRFECTFTIDAERNLCLSARDLVTGVLVKLNVPVHRLN
jgi:molecular chaperone DnaK (HSP70)